MLPPGTKRPRGLSLVTAERVSRTFYNKPMSRPGGGGRNLHPVTFAGMARQHGEVATHWGCSPWPRRRGPRWIPRPGHAICPGANADIGRGPRGDALDRLDPPGGAAAAG